MLKKKAITVLTMSVVLSTAIGYSTPHKSVHAGSKNLEQHLVSEENASLVLNQKSGSNDVSVVLEFSKDYNKSVTSFEVLIQLDEEKIKNVTMDWNQEFTTSHCRYTYDRTTGKLKLYVVEKNDLLSDRNITIGTMSLVSDETTNFNSSVVLEELKIVDLQHKSDVVTVDRTTHNVGVTVSDKPSTDKPSTDNPSTDKPSTDKPSTDKPSTDKPSTDKPSTDNSTTDKPSTDNSTTGGSSTGNSTTGDSSTGNSTTGNSSTGNSSTGDSSTGNTTTDNSSTETQGTTSSNTEVNDESDEESTTLTEDESFTTQESETGENQNDTLDSSNSEVTTESQTGDATEKKVSTATIIIACIIAAILVVCLSVLVIVKLKRGKISNKYQEKLKIDRDDEL